MDNSEFKNYSKNLNHNLNRLAVALSYESYEDTYYAEKRSMNEVNNNKIREEKVRLVRDRVRTGYYNKREVLLKVVDKILKKSGLD